MHVYSTNTTLPSKNASLFMINRCNNDHVTMGPSDHVAYYSEATNLIEYFIRECHSQ